jgi:hypothetical protein
MIRRLWLTAAASLLAWILCFGAEMSLDHNRAPRFVFTHDSKGDVSFRMIPPKPITFTIDPPDKSNKLVAPISRAPVRRPISSP